ISKRFVCPKNSIARHNRCGVYCGARETVGGSSVSSGCWGEDSNHENGWALRPPRCSAHSIYDEAQDSLRFSFFALKPLQNQDNNQPAI
ncbi:MAG TPA: hypothetical protein VIT19_10940, partial [Pyrinomonadaceae bacterium]